MKKRRTTPYSAYKQGLRGRMSLASEKKTVVSSRKDLIRLNTRSLRKKAILAHQKAERALAQLQEQLKHYHEQDVPGFRSWMHRTFGPLLTRQRELERAIEDKQVFIYEIHAMAHRYRLSDLAAYRKVVWRRAHPDEAQAEDLAFEEAERQRQQARSKNDLADDIFGDDDPELDDIFGDDEFEDDPDGDEDGFDAFFESMTGIRLPSRKAGNSNPDQKTVKELYRNIVRPLHPDQHRQMSDARKSLWHEAQAAYRRHDLNALHSILGRCEDGEAGLGDHSPISLIRRMTEQLKKATQSARREIRTRKRDVAWDYETRIKNPNFVRGVRADLQNMVHDLQWTLDDIQREMARLERMAARQEQQRQPPKRKADRTSRATRQDDLPF
ncbi:MAG: hypothetical protein WCS01_05215 [bacterium]